MKWVVVTCLVYKLFPGWWPSTGQNIRVTLCTNRGRRNKILWGREVVFHYHCQFVNNSKLDVCWSMHHSIIRTENPTRCNSVSKFYFIFIWSSTCFGRQTAHHQEPKTALAASGFAYVEGCWTCSCWTLTGRVYFTQHISGDTPPIIRSLKLHWQPLVLHRWRVVGRVAGGRCQVDYTLPDNGQKLHVQQPSTYAKPEVVSAVLGSWWWTVCRPKYVE
jgi:hypothetical protein